MSDYVVMTAEAPLSLLRLARWVLSFFAVFIFMTACALARGGADPSPPSTQPAVTVLLLPATVHPKTFDPAHVPPGVPLDPDVELAASQATFSCSSDVDFVIRKKESTISGVTITAQVKAIRIKLALDVTLWLPTDVPTKLRSHEEGHATISQKFYEDSQKLAEEAGGQIVGLSIIGEGADQSAAIRDAAAKVNKRISQDYLQRTSGASAPIQEAYDQLTDHGGNNLPEETAIRLAMTQAVKSDPPKSP